MKRDRAMVAPWQPSRHGIEMSCPGGYCRIRVGW